MRQVQDGSAVGDGASVSAFVRSAVMAKMGLRGHYEVVCRDETGKVKWRDRIDNLVTNAGEDYMLDVGLSGAAQIATWYLGLTDSTPTVAEGDTMASHAGWVEDQNYTQGTRITWVDGGVAAQSVDNSASVASYSINATTTIGGVFLASVNVKGGATGTLYAVGAFTGGDRSVDNLDTLEVTATYTAGGA